jgi:ElaB/YqjD/DUF883 family membrane-anchored ribosome-binding protein
MELKEKLDSSVNMAVSPLRATDNSATMGFNAESATAKLLDRQAFERIASTAHQAVDKFAHVATESAHSLDLKRKQMAETGLEVVNHSRKFIQEKPGTSIAIALVSGFLLRHFLRFR